LQTPFAFGIASRFSHSSSLTSPSASTQTIPEPLQITLSIEDSELTSKLNSFNSVNERNQFALSALRVGVIALSRAQSEIDSKAVRNEVDRMLLSLDNRLKQHNSAVTSKINEILKDYFDPKYGSFVDRVSNLTSEGGQLSQLLRTHIHGEDSLFMKQLGSYLGDHSPIMQMVDPSNRSGLMQAISVTLSKELSAQRESILKEFSLDNKQGSLNRLITEIKQQQGTQSQELNSRIDKLVTEFSLDKENSALSRLVRRVEATHQNLRQEFSLDISDSALFRLRNEMLQSLERQTRSINAMEKLVIKEMGMLTVKRQGESELVAAITRSPEHGLRFEAAVFAFLQRISQQSNDIIEHVGTKVGWIKGCKVGDVVLTIGPEQHASGARIVFEAKDAQGYTMSKAMEELEIARKNRSADIGVFIFGKKSAPANIPAFSRLGHNVIIVWDHEAGTKSENVYFEAAISVAKAICTYQFHDRSQESKNGGNQSIETAKLSMLSSLEYAIRDVEKQAESLDEIKKSAESIHASSAKILTRVRILDSRLEAAVNSLDEFSSFMRTEYGYPMTVKKSKKDILELSGDSDDVDVNQSGSAAISESSSVSSVVQTGKKSQQRSSKKKPTAVQNKEPNAVNDTIDSD
jgi:hypothetical protein